MHGGPSHGTERHPRSPGRHRPADRPRPVGGSRYRSASPRTADRRRALLVLRAPAPLGPAVLVALLRLHRDHALLLLPAHPRPVDLPGRPGPEPGGPGGVAVRRPEAAPADPRVTRGPDPRLASRSSAERR